MHGDVLAIDAAAITDMADIAVRSNAPSEILLFDLA